MAEMFQLTVLTPERMVLDRQIESLVAPGADGYLGVLAHHAPLITTLAPGKLTIHDSAGESLYAISGGFLEVSDNRATILADAVESPREIDVERARRARERAEERLRDAAGKWDAARAQASLARALNRIRIADNR